MRHAAVKGRIFPEEPNEQGAVVADCVIASAPKRTRKVMARILVVDDHPGCRALLLALLQSEGHDVTAAANGALAMSACRHATPDLIVLDLDMPEMDGVTFMRLLRSNDQWRRTPVLLLTGQSFGSAVDQAIAFGVIAHFVKGSLDTALFLDHVRACVDGGLGENPSSTTLDARCSVQESNQSS